MAKALKLIAVNVLVFCALVLLIEAILQLIALLRPSYDVIYMQPDRVVGWKQVPHLHWTWAGNNWYASDFRVEVQTNALGFRDLERAVYKPPTVRRVALLGDSFIEAVQVPLKNTAGQLLERRLNASSRQGPKGSSRWEVLNFGVSNFGVGQYLLTWQQYAEDYRPDYVAIFVARFHMARTLDKYEDGAFLANRQTSLWIRPTFRVEYDQLILEPARDFQQFVKAQQHLIAAEFAGQRSRRKHGLIIPHYAKELKDGFTRLAVALYHRLRSTPVIALSASEREAEAALLDVNLRIIEELGRKIDSLGSRLIILDASRYFGDSETVATALKGICVKHNFGYIALYDDLLKANANGVATRWRTDGHFNEAGNDILARAFFHWLTQRPPENGPQ